jgi:hypothetical protein
VSSELRIFSGKLEQFMGGLGGLVLGLVEDVALMLKQVRMRRHFLQIVGNSASGGKNLSAVLARKEAELNEVSELVKQDWGKLTLQIHRALQLCETGNSLSRSAKIEAVYGGDMTAALKQVSNEIEGTINQILTILKTLKIQMAD